MRFHLVISAVLKTWKWAVKWLPHPPLDTWSCIMSFVLAVSKTLLCHCCHLSWRDIRVDEPLSLNDSPHADLHICSGLCEVDQSMYICVPISICSNSQINTIPTRSIDVQQVNGQRPWLGLHPSTLNLVWTRHHVSKPWSGYKYKQTNLWINNCEKAFVTVSHNIQRLTNTGSAFSVFSDTDRFNIGKGVWKRCGAWGCFQEQSWAQHQWVTFGSQMIRC